MKYRFRFNLTISAIFFSVAACFGQVNQIDPTFSAVPSSEPNPGGQVVQADGKIVVWVADNFLIVDGVPRAQIARLNVDGTLDSSFDHCGCIVTGITNVILRSDGKLIVSGTGSNSQAKVILLNSDGSVDGTFNTSFNNFGVVHSAKALAIQPDGRVLVQVSDGSNGVTNRDIYRLNIDGSRDTSFTLINLGGCFSCPHVGVTLLLPDGKIMFSFAAFTANGYIASLSRFNPDGTSDQAWSSPSFATANLYTTIDGLDRQADGSIIVGGRFDTVNAINKPNFVRLLPAGNVDLSWGTTGFSQGGQLRILSSGKILTTASLATPFRIYRLNPDGSIDPSFVFDTGVNSVSLENPWSLDPSGRIVLFGDYGRFYRLSPDGAAESGFNPNVGSPGKIFSAVRQADGRIIVGGNFVEINGISKQSLARLNSDGSLDTSFDPGTGFAPSTYSLSSLTMQPDGKLLAVGSFTSYNGAPRNGFARINTDGSLDTAYDPVFNSAPQAIAVQTDSKIVAVGSFSTVNGTSRPLMARLNANGSLDSSFAPVIGGPSLTSVAIHPDGRIIFGGSFSGVNGFSRSNLARLNADGTLDQSFNAGSVSTAYHIWLQPDGKALLDFFSSLVRRNIDGTADNIFTPPNLSGHINCALVQSDGSIVVGGAFNSVNNFTRNNIARLSATGALDRFFFLPGTNGEVFTLAAEPAGKVIVGGMFNRFNNTIRVGIVRINTAPFHKVTPFDFDGDGRTDISVTRPGSSYIWYQLVGPNYTFTQTPFGQTGDVVTPADFDGDGIADLAIFRSPSGDWWYRSSITGNQLSVHWGTNGDIPLPGDIDGDGKADFVVYRPSNFTWCRLVNGGFSSSVVFGAAGDKPLLADFDGDGKADPAIFRPSTGTFWYAASSAGGAHRAVQWGISTDVPVPADYDGDGKTDFAVYRASEGAWYILQSSNNQFFALQFGIAEDRPIPADYDGDGKADIAVYRPSTGIWYLLQSTSGFAGFQWGISTDVPSPAAYIPQ